LPPSRCTRARRKEYRNKRGFTKKKRNEVYQEEQMKTLETINSVRDRRQFYGSLQESKGEFKPRVSMCRKNSGGIATSKGEVVTRWKE
jgi:hypothetical protein